MLLHVHMTEAAAGFFQFFSSGPRAATDVPTMRTLATTAAFDFDELRFEWGDVVLAAIGWGEWQRLERSVAEGLACASDSAARGEQVDDESLSASVVKFRRARGLLAGEEYMRWLDEHALAAADVRAHFARAALRERAAHRLDDLLGSYRPEPGPIAQAIRVEVIVDGRLRSWAQRLAGCVAASRGLTAGGATPPSASAKEVGALLLAAAACRANGLDEPQVRDRAPRVATLQAAERIFSARVVTSEQIERCLSEHRLDWQRFVWEEARFATEGAAREAALWVRQDGMALGEVATLAHATVDLRAAYSDAVPELSGVLAATPPGELVGPLAGERGWRLILTRERTPPAVDDPVLRERASSELVDQALERHLVGRVAWHGKY